VFYAKFNAVLLGRVFGWKLTGNIESVKDLLIDLGVPEEELEQRIYEAKRQERLQREGIA
jgi:hypothetical protein